MNWDHLLVALAMAMVITTPWINLLAASLLRRRLPPGYTIRTLPEARNMPHLSPRFVKREYLRTPRCARAGYKKRLEDACKQ